MMKTNEGGVDRAVRVVLGIVALIASFMWLGVMDGNVLGIIIAAAGAVLVITGFVGFCPAYKICGLSTCNVKCCDGSCDSQNS